MSKIQIDLPKNIEVSTVPDAIFISSPTPEATEGIDHFTEQITALGVDYPIPTYVSEPTLDYLRETYNNLSALDLTTIRAGTETLVKDKYVIAKGEDDNMKFSFEHMIVFSHGKQPFRTHDKTKAFSREIVARIPEHETYCEPYCGGATVYFSKKPSEVEILSDTDRGVVNSYRFIRDGGRDDFELAARLIRSPVDEKLFTELKSSFEPTQVPNVSADEFADFYKMTYYSQDLSREEYSSNHIPKISSSTLSRLSKRMDMTKILNRKGVDVMMEFDSPNTLFYVEPKKISSKELKQVIEACSTASGKFILNVDACKEINPKVTLPEEFTVSRIAMGDDGGYHLIASNFNLSGDDLFSLSQDKEKLYRRWSKLVNMSAGELRKFMNSKEGVKAGLSEKEAKKEGIGRGRDSARMLLKMIPSGSTYKSAENNWTETMWEWAGRQVSFISRMLGNKGPLYEDDNKTKTRKHTSLLIWGHNPRKGGGGRLSAMRPFTHLQTLEEVKNWYHL